MSVIYEGTGNVKIYDAQGKELKSLNDGLTPQSNSPLDSLNKPSQNNPSQLDSDPESIVLSRVTETKTPGSSPVNGPLNTPINRPIGSNPKKNNGKDKLGRGETDSPEDFDKLIDELYQKAIEPFSVDYDSINENSLSQIE